MYNKVCNKCHFFFFFFHFSFLASMRTKNILNELSLFLDSQPICIVSFEFPTMGNSLHGDPSAYSKLYKLHSFSLMSCSPYYSYYYHLLSFLSRIANPLFLRLSLFFPCFPPRFSTPTSPSILFIYSLR